MAAETQGADPIGHFEAICIVIRTSSLPQLILIFEKKLTEGRK
jgi:hypothetical protein